MTSIFGNTVYYTSILETDINEHIVKVPLKRIDNKTINKVNLKKQKQHFWYLLSIFRNLEISPSNEDQVTELLAETLKDLQLKYQCGLQKGRQHSGALASKQMQIAHGLNC